MRKTRALRRVSGNLRVDDSSRARVRKTTVRARVFLCRAVLRSNVAGAPVCHVDLRRVAEDGRSDLETPNDGDIGDGGEVSASASASFPDSAFAIPGTTGDPRVIARRESVPGVCPVSVVRDKIARAVLLESIPERGDEFPSGFRSATK